MSCVGRLLGNVGGQVLYVGVLLNKPGLKLLVLDYAKYQAQRSQVLERLTQIFGGEWGA